MLKKKILGVSALLGVAALGLASCGENAQPTADPNEFDVNEDAKSDVTMYIIGSHWNNWGESTIDKADPSCAFTLDANSAGLDTRYVYTAVVTEEMVGGWVGFKFIATPSWSSQFGMEDVDYEASKDFFATCIGDKNEDGTVDIKDKYYFHEGTSNRNNVVITKAGTYEISYYPYHFASNEENGVPYTNKFAITYTETK